MTIPQGIDFPALEQAVGQRAISVSLESLQFECDTEILRELLENLLGLALRYTESVCRFQQIVEKYGHTFDEQGERSQIEKVRGTTHESFNEAVTILCRTMSRQGKNTLWYDKVGKEDRARLGRFALSIAFEFIKQGGNP